MSDYRPICILPSLSKVLEKLIKNQITDFLDDNELLNRYQSGFRKKHNTGTALLKVTHDIRAAMDKKLLTVLLLLDFSKAFDSISFDKLCNKLKLNFNFSNSACTLIENYLKNRLQYVSSFLPVYKFDTFTPTSL